MKEEHTSMDHENTVEEESGTTEETPAGTVEDTDNEQEAPSSNEEEVDKTPEELEIEKLKQEAQDWQDRALRAQADLDNVRRRAKEEKEKDAKYRAQELIESLLPILDNFERAINAAPENEDSGSLLQGVNMVYSQLYEALQNEGLEAIETERETFDPHQHQAVMQVEEEGFESNQIVEELQKGYRLKDKIIRPAMVKVNS